MIRYHLKYRILFIPLVITLFVFTIGIPLVLSSCPMARANGGHAVCCPACSDATLPGIHAATSSSCCRTIIGAQHSSTEYVTISSSDRFNGVHQSLSLLSVPYCIRAVHNNVAPISIALRHLRAPTLSSDAGNLPVLFSSLLM